MMVRERFSSAAASSGSACAHSRSLAGGQAADHRAEIPVQHGPQVDVGRGARALQQRQRPVRLVDDGRQRVFRVLRFRERGGDELHEQCDVVLHALTAVVEVAAEAAAGICTPCSIALRSDP
jgi:hypothetical protein